MQATYSVIPAPISLPSISRRIRYAVSIAYAAILLSMLFVGNEHVPIATLVLAVATLAGVVAYLIADRLEQQFRLAVDDFQFGQAPVLATSENVDSRQLFLFATRQIAYVLGGLVRVLEENTGCGLSDQEYQQLRRPIGRIANEACLISEEQLPTLSAALMSTLCSQLNDFETTLLQWQGIQGATSATSRHRDAMCEALKGILYEIVTKPAHNDSWRKSSAKDDEVIDRVYQIVVNYVGGNGKAGTPAFS